MSTHAKTKNKSLFLGFILTAGSGYWAFSNYTSIPPQLEWPDVLAIFSFLVGAAILIASTPGEEFNYDEKAPY